MNDNLTLISAIFIPVLGAFALPILGRLSLRLRNACAFLLVLASFLLCLKLVPTVLAGKSILVSQQLIGGFSVSFLADSLAVFVACVSSLVSSIIVFYSFGYISHYENQNEYYLMVVLFLGSMIGLVFSANLILLYLFWEITAITSWRLIGFFRNKEYIFRADKAFLVTVFGALLMLIGFIAIYQRTGSFELLASKDFLNQTALPNFIVLLILAGILSKSATLPFHTWLPDAGVAPSPVTALLHAAVLVKIGVYVYARLFISTFTISEFWHIAVPVIAAASAIIAAGAALVETDLKRIIAYSTVSQIGFIFFGFAVGNPVGITGSLLYILMHGLAKAGLFLCAGIVEQNTKHKDITKMGGLIATMPVTAVSFLFCALSVMGVPPFGGFFSKYLIFSGSIQARDFLIAILFLACAVLTIMYLFRTFNLVFLAEAHGELVKEKSFVMVASVALLAVLSLMAGLFIYYPNSFAQIASIQMLGILK